MFDAGEIAEAFAARRAGHSLPQALYTRESAFAFDMEVMFRRNWLMVGFEAELPKPGSWMSASAGPWPILITRDRAGCLHGFHNTCRHRGARLCPPGKGAASRLVCPYHRWTYELSGELVHAARMPPDFDPHLHGLGVLQVRSVEGMILVCLAETPPPIDEVQDALAPLLKPHRLDRAKVAHESVLVEKANWKLVMENARECYHCAVSHPQLARSFPVEVSAHFDYGEDRRQEDFVARLEAMGLPCGPAEGDGWQAVRFVLNQGAVSMTSDGRHAVRRLMCETGAGDIGSLRWALEPNSFAHAAADHLFMFSVVPVGPRETHVISKWLVHADAVEGEDYRLEDLINLWTTTNLQDRDLVENNQLGVESPGYRPGPYCPEAESLLIGFTDWYCQKAREALESSMSSASPARADIAHV